MMYLFHNIKHSADSDSELEPESSTKGPDESQSDTMLVQVRRAQQRWLGPLLPLPPARDLRPALHRLHPPQVSCAGDVITAWS